MRRATNRRRRCTARAPSGYSSRMSESERVLITVDRHVAHVRLNRPDKRNGLDLGMFEGLISAGEQLAANKAVRSVVLSGEGPAFCAGLDWMAFMSSGP